MSAILIIHKIITYLYYLFLIYKKLPALLKTIYNILYLVPEPKKKNVETIGLKKNK